MSRFQKGTIFIIIMIIGRLATATTYVCDGKELTKGQVVIGLASKSYKKCTKTDELELNLEKGTLRNKKK